MTRWLFSVRRDLWAGIGQDVRYGARTLARSPGYSLIAGLILALGIGANTAMFSVVHGVLFAPLPFPDGAELVLLRQQAAKSGLPDARVSLPELREYRARLTSVRDLVEYHRMSFTLLDQGEPDRVDTAVVSANFFDVLGVHPMLGRSFVGSDDDLGAPAVLILSHEYWIRKFGADPHVLGRVLEMNNRPHTVVGVLPPYPQYPQANDVYMPTSACPFRARAEASPTSHRTFASLQVFGRLTPGVTAEQASGEIASIARSFERAHPQDYEAAGAQGLTGEAVPLEEALVSKARGALSVLVGVTLLVLLIASANVANLALARALPRSRELAVRTALGSSRGRLLRQLLTENLLLAAAGGALGIFLAWLSTGLLVDFVGRFTPRTGQIAIDGPVLAFALVVSLVTAVVSALAPALALRRSLAEGMRDGDAQAGEGRARHRLRSALVVAQVAVSFALLVGAALLLESFFKLATAPLGFETRHVMTAAIYGNFTSRARPDDRRRFDAQVLGELRASPGVLAASLTGAVPQSAIVPGRVPVTLEGVVDRRGSGFEADRNFASDGYFETLGVPLLSGRDFRSSDTPQAPPVAIVNRSMARLWGGADPVGRRFTTTGPGGPTTFTVVGVAADYRLYDVTRANPAQYYLPVSQNPGTGTRVLVRVSGDPRSAAAAIERAVHRADPQTPVEDLATIAEIRSSSQLAAPRLTAVLLSVFALLALAITLAGIGGVIGTSVSQRSRELGVRMALGASPRSILRGVLRQGLALAAAGIALGAAGAALFGRLLSSFLFETSPLDPTALTAVAALFLLVTVLAAAGPARRATTIDPLAALRIE